jgi:hypothetical protein
MQLKINYVVHLNAKLHEKQYKLKKNVKSERFINEERVTILMKNKLFMKNQCCKIK